MEYKLAKELKDAGFPLKPIEAFGSTPPEHRGGNWTPWKMETGDYHAPSLSELIEACVKISPDGDFHLEAMYGHFGAGTCFDKDPMNWHEAPIPEEAVARLWLALNRPTQK